MKGKFLIGLFIIALFITFLGPVTDIDFPFHLKTGQFIYEHKEIPKDDPFTFPSQGALTDRKTFYLTQYWFAQVIFYKLYTIAGPAGIILLRATIFSSLVFFLWFSIRKRGTYSSLLIAILATIVLLASALDRPQYFSFFFALLLLLLLEKFRENPHSARPLFFIPLLMLLWSNIHAGFVFGMAIIVLYTISEALKFFAGKFSPGFPVGSPLSDRALLMLLSAGLLGILFSYINPNTTGALVETVGSHSGDKWIYANIREYMSALEDIRFPYGAKLHNIALWILFGITYILMALTIIRKKSIDLTHLTLIAFVSYTAFTAVRYVPFFIVIAIPLMKDYSFFKETDFLKRLNKRLFIAIIFSLFFLFVIGFRLKDYKGMFQFQNDRVYPERTAKFLLDNRINANMFNSNNKGSYLIWRLYPYYRVFMDTRHLTRESDIEGLAIMSALESASERSVTAYANALSGLVPKELGSINISAGSDSAALDNSNNVPPLWKKLLRNHQIDLIVHEATSDMTGVIFPLTLRLLNDDEWVLIYLDGTLQIFIRNDERYSEIIRRYKKPKALVYDEIMLETARLVKGKTTYAAPYSSLALALVMKGQEDDAKKMINAALDLDKTDLVANFCTAYLELLQKQRGKKISGNNSEKAAYVTK